MNASLTPASLYNESLTKFEFAKYKKLSTAMDKAVNDGNAEIQRLEGKLKGMKVEPLTSKTITYLEEKISRSIKRTCNRKTRS